MSNRKKRSYNSKGRQAQAVETKYRILDAAKKLFQEEGFEGMTIEKLAKASHVSSPTVYALFQSKLGVLRALLDNALPFDQYESLLIEVQEASSAKKRLLLAAKISRHMYDAEKMQMELFRGASVLAPKLKELEKEREERRYERQEESVQIMVEEDVLPQGINSSKARDILWAFTGRDLYRMLVLEKEWSSDDYEDWLGKTLIKTLMKKDK